MQSPERKQKREKTENGNSMPARELANNNMAKERLEFGRCDDKNVAVVKKCGIFRILTFN